MSLANKHPEGLATLHGDMHIHSFSVASTGLVFREETEK